MKLSVDELNTERQWRAATGYDQERFYRLLAIFDVIYARNYGESIEAVRAKSPMACVIQNCEELLLFTLFSLKSGLTYDNLGWVTGMDGSTAKRNQDLGLSILKEALQEAGVAPKRGFTSVEEFQQHFEGFDTVIIDGTEQRIERPQDPNSQKENYSGKKKLTPLKRPSLQQKTRSSAS